MDVLQNHTKQAEAWHADGRNSPTATQSCSLIPSLIPSTSKALLQEEKKKEKKQPGVTGKPNQITLQFDS